MIRKSIISFIMMGFVLYLPFQAGAVVQWTKSSSNPVLTTATSGDWDDFGVGPSAVIKEGGTYKMWYIGLDDVFTSTKLQTGYATSLDGISWTKYDDGATTGPPYAGSDPVLTPGSSGEWDDREAAVVGVVIDNDAPASEKYKMWYTGSDDAVGEIDSNENIGYATSSDGITWSKYNIFDTGTPYAESDPVLTKGVSTPTADWDGDGVYGPTVIIDDDAPPSEKYKMWYVGYQDTFGYGGIGYAYSGDGVTWTKYNNPDTTSAPFANSDPVINKWGFPWYWGPQGAWNEKWMSSPSVIKEGSIYRMWLKGKDNSGMYRIGYFFSVDGVNWTQYRGNPVVMEGDTALDDFDEYGVSSPVVIKDGNTYKMWYAGDKDCDTSCLVEIGYATAPAYSGTRLEINKMRVATDNRSGGMSTFIELLPEGPAPLDFTELKVEGPGGLSYIFSSNDLWNSFGYQDPFVFIPGMPSAGTYTFTAKSNNGLTATNSIEFTNPTAIPVYDTGSSGLDMHIKVGSTFYYHQSYVGTTTPTFRFKPAGGTEMYYRVQIFNYRGSSWTVWVSGLIPGTVTIGGYIDISVPPGVLAPDSPYRFRVEIFDTDDKWTAHNRASCDLWEFYTGVRDETATPDFIDWIRCWSERSFLGGDRANFGVGVINLAPWDIDASDGNFSVLNEDLSTLYNFYNGYNTSNEFYYWGGFSGIPADAVSPGYTFVATENFSGNSRSESVITPYQDVSTLPMVTRKDMLLDDNAYLADTTPTLSWISQGAGYKYRIFITTFTGHETFISSRQDGAAAGQVMSETISPGILREYSPYFWWVEIFDTNLNSRTRSNRLTFQTGYLVIFIGDAEPDGDVDGSDLDIFTAAYAIGDMAADLDGSGVVDAGDVAVFAADFGKTDRP